tara:strand:+ start:73 stop:357 length:285 start_codon:yes stop_codon:yes gene_type:complete
MKTLKITPRKNYHQSFNLFTNHPFFRLHEELVFDHDEWGVSFRVPSIDDTDTIKVYENGLSCSSLNVFGKDIQHGILLYDEDYSDDDTIYFTYQ